MSNALSTTWPSGSANQGWPQEPTGMLMPGRIQGWPAGTQRAANPATTLLSQAVAWWDVEQYREGDRFLRNRGTGGELLDLRLGSANVANSNEPLWLGPEQTGYVYLPGGTVLNSLSVADPFNNTGDLDISVHLDGNIDANNTRIIDGGGVNFHWNAGVITLVVNDASGLRTISATVSATAYRNTPSWFRVAYTDSTRTAVFYAANGPAAEYPTSWTTLHTGSHAGGARVATTGTSHICNRSDGLRGLEGRLSRVIVDNGATRVLDVDCDAITSGSATSFTAGTGQTVTINRSTSGRKAVAVPSRHKGGKPVMLLGTDDYLECVDNWQHGLLNFGQGDSFTVLAVLRSPSFSTNQVIIAKRITSSASPGTAGWVVRNGATVATIGVLIVDDGAQFSFASLRQSTGLNVLTAVRDIRDRRLRPYVNEASGAVASDVTAGLTTSSVVRIGALSNGGSPADMEFYAAAIFRQALSPAEITLLSNYFTGRIA